MSSTTTTQYYGLTQYTGNDKPDFADNNEAFREVDAALHGVVQDSEGFGTSIAALQEAQNALTTEVTGLTSDLNTEKAKITALQNKETLQDAEIAGVKADALDMIEAKDEGTAQVATVAVAAGEYFRYNDVLYIATTNIAVGDTIVPNTNCRATNVGTELEGLAEDIAEVKSDLDDVEEDLFGVSDTAYDYMRLFYNKKTKLVHGWYTRKVAASNGTNIFSISEHKPTTNIITYGIGHNGNGNITYGKLTIASSTGAVTINNELANESIAISTYIEYIASN